MNNEATTDILSADELPFEQFEQARQTGKLPEGTSAAAADTGKPEPGSDSDPDKQKQDDLVDPKKDRQSRKFQKRIDELTKRNRELEAKAGASTDGKTAAAATSDGEPKPEDFPSYEAHEKALIDWKAQQKVKELEAARAEEAATKAVQESWTKRLDTAKAAHADFDEVLKGSDIEVTRAMGAVLLESDHGAELLYHLAQNEELADKLADMTPTQVARELGKLEARLFPDDDDKGKPEPPTKKATDAPKPPAKIRGGASTRDTSNDLFDEDIDQAEFERRRNAQLKANPRY